MANRGLETTLDELETAYDRSADAVLEGFLRLLRFQSVSTDSSYQEQVSACADYVEGFLRSIGLTVERWPTTGHPTLFATHLKAGPDRPTLLIYNHYDVQPVDPVDLWKSPPFDPQVRNGEVYARGAQDNKGQLWYVLQAVKGFMDRGEPLPVNLKLCIEGEEECGSTGLSGILKERREALQADYLLVADMGLHGPASPAITMGVRGLCTMEVVFRGSTGDLHSGSHGGMAYNPNHALVEVLAKLRDQEGRVTVPGFYDDVKTFTPEELALFDFDVSEAEYEKLFGCKPTGGERAFPFMQSATIRPTLEINGLSGGYTGPGFKTVIPSEARAKISCRLVPNQDPQKIQKAVADHLKSLVPAGIEMTLDLHTGMGRAVIGNPKSALAEAFSKAYSEVFGKPCARILEGGSIPIIAEMAKVSGAEVLLMGLGLPGDNIHAPNEHFGVNRLRQGYLVMTLGLTLLGKTAFKGGPALL